MLYYRYSGRKQPAVAEESMPPRTRRESPIRRETRIRKHLPKAKEYWSKWPIYLAEGDLCQAGEKGWGGRGSIGQSGGKLSRLGALRA